MKFESLFISPLSPLTNSNINLNKIKVNKYNSKVMSPIYNSKILNNIIINKNNNSGINKNKIKILKKNNNNVLASTNCLQDINYIKYININVDIDKIKYIQIWWKYLYKIIVLQKNIRQFIVYIKTKQNLKYFKRWDEINNKRIILTKLIIKKKISQNEKLMLNTNNIIKIII